MDTHASAENYLETILILKNRLGAVRSVDIVNELDFTRASVSVAMKKLRESGHIEMDTLGCITLTKSGLKVAEEMYERHNILAKFLIKLGVDEETAYEDSCKIEHVISEKSFRCIKEHMAALNERQ